MSDWEEKIEHLTSETLKKIDDVTEKCLIALSIIGIIGLLLLLVATGIKSVIMSIIVLIVMFVCYGSIIIVQRFINKYLRDKHKDGCAKLIEQMKMRLVGQTEARAGDTRNDS